MDTCVTESVFLCESRDPNSRGQICTVDTLSTLPCPHLVFPTNFSPSFRKVTQFHNYLISSWDEYPVSPFYKCLQTCEG